MKRTVIKIDDELCNGCGACITGCHEGALQMINGKAVMVSELYCDGLGACIGECPVGAITLEEREAEPYSEIAVMERIAPKGEAVIVAHLNHLKDHGEAELLRQGLEYLEKHDIHIDFGREKAVAPSGRLGAASGAGGVAPSGRGLAREEPLACGCPGSMMRDLRRPEEIAAGGGLGVLAATDGDGGRDGERLRSTARRTSSASGTPIAPYAQPSELRQFPVQLHLLNPAAPFLCGANLLLAADCTAFASGDFHGRFLKGKMLAIACPKLDDDTQSYVEKLTEMIDLAQIDTLTVLVMEVPCCGGLVRMATMARESAQRNIPIKTIVLSVRGEVISEKWI